jgi:hypothetical protein
VHWQFSVPHCCVTVLQHWFARQSPFEWQQFTHEPLVQHSVEGQSELAQQAAVVHVPLQHFCPPGHSASEVQAQFSEPHVCVATSQHWLAGQSLFVQQFPGTHSRRVPSELPSDSPLPLLPEPLPELLAALPPKEPSMTDDPPS